MQTSIFSDVMQKLAAMSRKDLLKLASDTGVSIRTIEKIAAGQTTDPRVKTIEPLILHFQQQDSA